MKVMMKAQTLKQFNMNFNSFLSKLKDVAKKWKKYSNVKLRNMVKTTILIIRKANCLTSCKRNKDDGKGDKLPVSFAHYHVRRNFLHVIVYSLHFSSATI